MNRFSRHALMVLLLTMFMVPSAVQSADFLVETIISDSLEQEKALFCKFYTTYCDMPQDNPMMQRMLGVAFSREEKAYFSRSATLFFHAMLQDQVIGYISCDVAEGYRVYVRQLVVDPDYFDAILIKELLFAIFENIPQVKSIIIECPVGCSDMHEVLQSFGFNVSAQQTDGNQSLYVTYQIEVHLKCKICDVMYGDQYWEMSGHEHESNDDWTAYDEDLDDGYVQNGDIRG